MRCFFFLAIALLIGCGDRVIYVESAWPVLPKLERPQAQLPLAFNKSDPEAILSGLHAKDISDIVTVVYELQSYAERLELIADMYNIKAAEHNERLHNKMLGEHND